MKLKLAQVLAGMALLCWACCGQAAISCSPPASTGFSTAYSPGGVVPNVTQGTVSFTCTRSSAGDATSLLLRADNGINVCKGSNDASLGNKCINYEAYQNSNCTTLWTNNNNATSIPITLSDVVNVPQPQTINFWGCITKANQNKPAGVYTDTVTISIRTTGGALISGATDTMPVYITNPASCSITSISNVDFGTYIAFSAAPVVANANIVLDCTSELPYDMALDTNTGLITGLNYSLTINSLTPPIQSRGTGPGQTHILTGTMPAGQAGTCSTGTCNGTQVHTLTITY